MPERESSRDIDRAAARWTARLDRGPLTADEQLALDQWTAGDSRRLGALARAMAVSARFDDLNTTATRPAPVRVGRRGLLFGGAAAAVAGVSFAIGGSMWQAEHDLQTDKGEFRVVRLRDGSTVWLNTDSRVKVEYSSGRRRVVLARGEALFDVAKDPSRPFVVRAGETDVHAVGTSFAVSRLGPDRPVEVMVQEGLVDVRGGPADRTVHLMAGCHAIAGPSGQVKVIHRGPEAVSRALSWRRGMLNFEDATLAQAAETFGRYSDERIVIDDPRVAQMTVTGVFSSTDPVGFAKAAALSLNLSARTEPGGVRLTR